MDFTTLANDVALDAQECPIPVIESALRRAVREFCEKTGLWAEDLAALALLADTAEYTLIAPEGAELVRVEKARYAGVPLTVYSEAEMDAARTAWRDDTGAGLYALVSLSRAVVRAYPVPSVDDANAVVVRAALKPDRSATTCHDDVEAWAEGVIAGALFYLKKMPGKPWTDREVAREYQHDFNEAIGDAMASVLRGHSSRSLQVKPRSFG